MDRITNKVIVALIARMSAVMGEPLEYEKGSQYYGQAWKINNAHGHYLIVGSSTRDLFNKAHAFMAGWYAHADKVRPAGLLTRMKASK
jgi:hypothetical protein